MNQLDKIELKDVLLLKKVKLDFPSLFNEDMLGDEISIKTIQSLRMRWYLKD